jgi:hypothetical protein
MSNKECRRKKDTSEWDRKATKNAKTMTVKSWRTGEIEIARNGTPRLFVPILSIFLRHPLFDILRFLGAGFSPSGLPPQVFCGDVAHKKTARPMHLASRFVVL